MLCETPDVKISCRGTQPDGLGAWTFPPLPSRRGNSSGGVFSAQGVMPVRFVIGEETVDANKTVTLEIDEIKLKALIKQANQESIREWLDAKLYSLSLWTFTTVAAGIVAGVAWLLVTVELPSWIVNHLPKGK